MAPLISASLKYSRRRHTLSIYIFASLNVNQPAYTFHLKPIVYKVLGDIGLEYFNSSVVKYEKVLIKFICVANDCGETVINKFTSEESSLCSDNNVKGSTRYVCLFVEDEVWRSFVTLNDMWIEIEVELSEVEFPWIEGQEAGIANCPWPYKYSWQRRMSFPGALDEANLARLSLSI